MTMLLKLPWQPPCVVQKNPLDRRLTSCWKNSTTSVIWCRTSCHENPISNKTPMKTLFGPITVYVPGSTWHTVNECCFTENKYAFKPSSSGKSWQTTLQANTHAFLRICEYTLQVAIKKLADGNFALFDPHTNGFVDEVQRVHLTSWQSTDHKIGSCLCILNPLAPKSANWHIIP